MFAVLLGRNIYACLIHLASQSILMIRQSDKGNLKRLGIAIKKLREAKKLSLRELSYACDIDNSKISKIEKGQINITFTTILQLAKALEVHPTELLKTEFD